MPELICAAHAPRWQAERRKGITATDIVILLGLSSHSSPYSLFHEKTGILPPPPDNDRWRLGRELEPYILHRWNESHPDLWAYRSDLYRNDARPWQMATLDAVVIEAPENDDDDPHGVGPLELKSWADADKSSWADGPPPQVRAQVLWQMDTLDVATGHVGVLFLPSGEFRSYVISHEESYAGSEWGCNGDTCQPCTELRVMREAARDFLDRLDLGEPPDVDGSAASLAALRAVFAEPRNDKVVPIDAWLWQAWLDLKAHAKQLDSDAHDVEARIREQLGEAGAIEVDGTIVGRRVIADAQVKAHTRHQDYIRIIKREAADDDGQ